MTKGRIGKSLSELARQRDIEGADGFLLTHEGASGGASVMSTGERGGWVALTCHDEKGATREAVVFLGMRPGEARAFARLLTRHADLAESKAAAAAGRSQ